MLICKRYCAPVTIVSACFDFSVFILFSFTVQSIAYLAPTVNSATVALVRCPATGQSVPGSVPDPGNVSPGNKIVKRSPKSPELLAWFKHRPGVMNEQQKQSKPGIVTICAWCPAPAAPIRAPGLVSHTICPACLKLLLAGKWQAPCPR